MRAYNLLILLSISLGASAAPREAARALPAPAAAPLSAEAAVIQAERLNLDLEIELLRRKTTTLTNSLAERRAQTKEHLRLLYKLSSGGYLRLLAGADTPAEFYLRRDDLGRIAERDLSEIKALREELDELAGERDRLSNRQERAALLRTLEKAASSKTPAASAFLTRPGSLPRPVAGKIVATFGSIGNAEGRFDHVCDGVELLAQPGEPVRAVGAGEVRWVGTVPVLGLSIIIQHAAGWMSLTGGLKDPAVGVGSRVTPNMTLARAAGPVVELQLMQRGNWIDPAPWLMP